MLRQLKKMDKTKFPEKEVWESDWEENYPFYDGDEVDDWFKRCLDDLPCGFFNSDGFTTKIIPWLNKWFSQFTNIDESLEIYEK